MPCDYKTYPPEFRAVSRRLKVERAKNRCEQCGVRNYAVGYWDGEQFRCERGNAYWDQFQYADSYSEACEARDEVNGWGLDDGRRRIVIVLTCAHLCECEPKCAEPDHLKMLCQRHHLRLDAQLHVRNSVETRRTKRDQARPLLQEVELCQR